ncbi:MarR family winged helix-turn-helix transcriptional regulator [Actinacidiphila glaucinigra]|uniref:Transcriptional regulator, MarR family n=1 Tax=Actinacidiphila glaucinigra TaxID=235986 RepID=A0A239EBY9_9ACTN|nr:MarR family winged helix-turn-helix transcriptional regulator [Actinacidiphila glaucinigra]SNS42185.1 transcriptional regulator, MarR family [Actinacidiphila glaucinigra]
MAAVGEDDALEFVVSLHRLVRLLRRARPEPRVQPTPLIVLALLNQYGPCRVGVLAERAACTQPTVTAAVGQLEAGGLVRREPDPADGRATRVVMTAPGRRELVRMACGEAEALAARLATLPPEDVRKVLEAGRLLRRLTDCE